MVHAMNHHEVYPFRWLPIVGDALINVELILTNPTRFHTIQFATLIKSS